MTHPWSLEGHVQVEQIQCIAKAIDWMDAYVAAGPYGQFSMRGCRPEALLPRNPATCRRRTPSWSRKTGAHVQAEQTHGVLKTNA